MKRAVLARLNDMLAMIDAVADMTESLDLAAYKADLKTRLAVERCVEIVSEASRHIPEEARMRFSEVPWPEIAAIGNKLRHEYGHVDAEIMWRVAKRSLPELRPVVMALLLGER